MHVGVWQLQQAKARFSELVNQALEQGPQTVTRHGRETVVVVSVTDFNKVKGTSSSPLDFFRKGPYLDDVNVDRDRSMPREVDLCDS